ncbi:MAG: nicotinate phosphoribosyltransferase [Ardenticatenales bacterium]|nr:nicotinate phosphoribosyltransferase [Ardenticatenales bacterium]
MSIFNGTRLTNQTFKLDDERMRRGWYSDKYFENIVMILSRIAQEGATLADFGLSRHPALPERDLSSVEVGNIEVEMHFYTRRPFAVVAGVDKALAMLRYGAGSYENGRFRPTWEQLQVEAVQDGAVTTYDPDWRFIQPVIRVCGRYRDFALLETPMLGVLTRTSRIATNVYEVLKAARGKPVLFFPARFDAHEVQAADGYAYDIAVKRFVLDYRDGPPTMISTDAQGDWWGGAGGGTVSHAAIAAFLGQTEVAVLAFARFVPPEVPRIALVDYHNGSVDTAVRVARAMFEQWWAATQRGDEDAARYRLYAVRLDTSMALRDESVPPLGDKVLDNGVNPRLVWNVRQALDEAWRSWTLSAEAAEAAAHFCHEVKIVVSGGFNPAKIRWFEGLHVPADIYGIGTSILTNDEQTNTDFTADIVRVRVDGEWYDIARAGRQPGENPDLEPVDLGAL